MRCFLSLVFALAGAPAAADETWPAPLEAALADRSDGQIYSYDLRFESPQVAANGRVDPSRPKGERVTVAAPAKEDWPDGFERVIERIDDEADGDIWCASLSEQVPDDVELLTEDDQTAVYTFTPAPPPEAQDRDAKLFKNLVAELTVSKTESDVLGLRMIAPKAFKPSIAARIREFELSITCAPGPDGRRYSQNVVTRVKGSAAFRSFEQETVRTISALQPVGDAAP